MVIGQIGEEWNQRQTTSTIVRINSMNTLRYYLFGSLFFLFANHIDALTWFYSMCVCTKYLKVKPFSKNGCGHLDVLGMIFHSITIGKLHYA